MKLNLICKQDCLLQGQAQMDHFDPWKCLKKFLVGGWVGGGLSKYGVYSWSSFVKVKARFGQICD